jgi:oligosaccharide reducing-end xylanase
MPRLLLSLGLVGFACSTGDGDRESPTGPVASTKPTAASSTAPLQPVEPGANLFSSLAGKTQEEVDAKVTTAVNRFFGIGTTEATTPTKDTGYRCYYELPGDASMAFIWAADSNDIRSEGQSYGMMIAVQMDLHTEFDKLWKFAKAKMQYPSTDSAWKYYFKWQGKPNGTDWNFGGQTTPAPDGDEYFAAALYLADQRWGSTGGVNYKQEADNIASAMLHNTASGSRFPIIHTRQNMVVFVPIGTGNEFTDPSYHLPAFYEMFSLYGPTADAATWRSLAEVSRKFLVASAHATTGLHPDYATFQGAPTTFSAGDEHDQFRYDAWRVVMNMAMDYAWFSKDARMKTQVEKYHAFFASHITGNNIDSALFTVSGESKGNGGSTGLTATLAAGALASDDPNKTKYVNNLWSIAQQSGEFRYYQQSVYLLGLLNVAGKYKYSW